MSKRKDSFYTSDDSNDSNDELSLTKNKTKKKKINNESFEIDTKPRDRRRSTKESLFEKQMRLAMEQSLKETNQINDNSVASNDKLPNPEFGLVEKSPKAMHLSDVDETDIPVLCLYDKKDEKLCISKTEFDFLPKSSESNTLKSAEKKNMKSKKIETADELSGDEDFAKNYDDESGSDFDSPKQSKKKKSNKNLEKISSSKKKKTKIEKIEKIESPESARLEDENPQKLKRSAKTDSEKKASSSTKKARQSPIDVEKSDKENIKIDIKETSVKKSLDMSEKPAADFKQSLKENSINIDSRTTDNESIIASNKSLAGITDNVSSNISNITSIPSFKNTLFSAEKKSETKSTLNAIKSNNIIKNQTQSPLGRIEIKNNSPCVRVGLSRNKKIPSLHKNVKPF